MKNEALLVVDMSNDFVADEGGLTVGKPGQEIVPYIIDLANKFKDNGGHVVVTMDAHAKDDPHFELWPVHNVVGTKGQELFGDLHQWYEQNQEQTNVHYVPKANYNAFHQTNLADLLRKHGVEKVHVVGVCTDICDFLTVAGADAEGFKTVAHKRGMATFTENTEVFLNQMKLCFHTEIVE
jgi:nicotinamidase-related amidase